ncbi:EAL domain-containing protein [Polynucleobacter sp. JS-Safj-400b-B2]|uniref:bifunctional diguanylate cyclase/phosphodiesterase n=1 Tax=Polynucleobacter sp. JS-Safj-400b-B2 TaxID=2576921 RepID=UPI001C0D57F0|nr:EAL domain-containing protein [Polynucleobacter sp. JS-Safj-400b-B2]MBU3626754.1 EAL domain-containing protein [Polynucleobacter sp. JS-Safj-400b-B2]
MIISNLLHSHNGYTKKGVFYAVLAAIAQAVISTLLLNHFAGVVGESVIWIPAGIGLGVLLILGLQYWPFLFVGATIGEIGGGHTLIMAMLVAAGALIGYFIVVILLRRYLKFGKDVQSLGDFGRLFIASCIGAFVSTTINVKLLVWGNLLSPKIVNDVFQKWFIGDLFGFVFFTPILLVLSTRWIQDWPKRKQLIFALCLLASLVFEQAVFFGWLKEYIDLTGRGFAVLFVIAFFGYQFGRQGAMLYFCLLLIQSVLSVFHGEAFFDRQLMTHHAPMVIWAYLGIACFVGLAIGLVVESFERKSRDLMQATKDIVKSEERFRDIVGNTPVLMSSYDLETYVMDYVNPYFTKALGYTASDLRKPNAWWTLAYPDRDYRKEVEQEWGNRIREAGKTGSPFVPLEAYTTRKDGSVRLISWGSFFASDRMIIYGIDITEQKNAEDLLKVTSAVYRAMGEAVVICDAQNHILLANYAFRGLTGFSDEELLGHGFSDFLVKRHGAGSYADIFTSVDAVGRWEGQTWIKVKKGDEALRFLSIYSTFDKDGVPLQRVALLSDVTDQRKARELINQQANFDALTSLPNRRLLLDRLEQLMKQSTRSKTNLAVVYFDIDNFKEINDSRGHDFGDELLKAVALRLRSEVRDTDTIARIGGDEFVFLLSQIDKFEQVDNIIEQIIKNLSEPFHIQNEMVYITASFGISIFPEDGDDSKVLLLGADQAMYAAKANGKNGSQYFTSAMQIKANYRANVISELRVALEKKQFKLEYQPIFDVQTGAITHAEALLRWHRANGEVVMPLDFIDIAEESGLIVPIGNWVIQEVLLYLRALGVDRAPAIAINIAVSQFSSTDHSVVQWVDWIKECGISPNKIIFEITERMMLIQSQRVMDKIAILQEAGCKFSLDDFGTGYSSIVSLKNFNFDYLKIDAHFIKTLAPESLDASLVAAMISMARGLGMDSIAEGVETEAQAQILREMGCDYVQGFLYAKPLSAEAFKKILI